MSRLPEDELLSLSQKLLDSIDCQDWATYTSLVDASLSSFEPEGCGHFIEGLSFHRFYFEPGSNDESKQSVISSPNVRFLGENVAVVTYVRLRQTGPGNQQLPASVSEETRIWYRQHDGWRNVHFHRSKPGT